MKQFIKETFIFASVMAVVALLSGCMMCPAKKHNPNQPKPDIISYQYNRGGDVDMVRATVYTRSRNGGNYDMGYVKFKDTEEGLKMYANLTELRPGVDYTVYVNNRAMNLPTLRAGDNRSLDTSYMIPNMRAEQLRDANVYLKRDGGYTAAWGTLK